MWHLIGQTKRGRPCRYIYREPGESEAARRESGKSRHFQCHTFSPFQALALAGKTSCAFRGETTWEVEHTLLDRSLLFVAGRGRIEPGAADDHDDDNDDSRRMMRMGQQRQPPSQAERRCQCQVFGQLAESVVSVS